MVAVKDLSKNLCVVEASNIALKLPAMLGLGACIACIGQLVRVLAFNLHEASS